MYIPIQAEISISLEENLDRAGNYHAYNKDWKLDSGVES